MAAFFKKLAKQMIDWRKQKKTVRYSDWPDEIIFESDVVDKFRTLEKYTAHQSGMKQSGSTGWEYASTFVYLIDEVYSSKPVHGDYHSVVPIQKLKAEPDYSDDGKKVYFKIQIGDEEIKSKSYDRKDLSGNLPFGNVLVAHSHPKYIHEDNTSQYTFFSIADLKFLSKSSAYMLGMVSKSKIWIACKTTKFRSIDTAKIHSVTIAERKGGVEEMKRVIASTLRDSGLVFYVGSFGNKVEKVKYSGSQKSTQEMFAMPAPEASLSISSLASEPEEEEKKFNKYQILIPVIIFIILAVILLVGVLVLVNGNLLKLM